MGEHIVITFDDPDSGDTWRKKYKGLGNDMLRAFLKQSVSMTPKISGKMDDELHALFQAGMESATLSRFNDLKREANLC